MDIARLRLHSQNISGKKFTNPARAVAWMGAMQSQDYQQALWAVGVRCQNATRAQVEKAISQKKIIRTWLLRGTLHFTTPQQVRAMLQVSAPHNLAANKTRCLQLDIDDKLLRRCHQIFYKALQGHKRLTRPGMMALLEKNKINPSGQRGYHILWSLAQSSLLCMGPMQDRQQTFVLLDEWAGEGSHYDHEAALAYIAGRYIASHGPATAADFAGWARITGAEAKQGLQDARPKLVNEKMDNIEYWMTAATAKLEPPTEPIVYLLPAFDEYLIGYKNRDAMLRAADVQRVIPGKNGMFLPCIVTADGHVTGTWQRSETKTGLKITTSFFRTKRPTNREITAAIQGFAAFSHLPLHT